MVENERRDFPGDPVVRTLRFHCTWCCFDPWPGNLDPASQALQFKKKKIRGNFFLKKFFFPMTSRHSYPLQYSWASLALRRKKIRLQCRRAGSIPGLGRSPGGVHGNPLQHSCLENPHGQRKLVGYSPWGCKDLDPTERLSTHSGLPTTLLLI